MKKRFISAFLTALLLAVSFYAQKPKPRTTVKKPKSVVQIPDKSLNTIGVSIEKYVVNMEVNADGTSVTTREVLQRLTSPIAVKNFSKFEQTFNGDLEKAEVVETYLLKANGTKVPVPASAISSHPTPQAEAAPSFSSLKMIEIKFPETAVGDAIYFKVRTQTFKPQFAGYFDELEIFTSLFDWKTIEVNLSAPIDFPIYVQTVDLIGGKIADENKRSRWQWRRENFAALEIEEAMYDFVSYSPRLAVTSFKNYDELGAAYWKEAVNKAVVTPEVQKLADEITKDTKEPQQKAYAIYEWANKNIRYLSIVLDRGGWIPHDTTQILASGYGDCKDYTTILYALLKAVNIESSPVLIRSDTTDWFPTVASASYFNHAILYIPSLDVFADATAPNTRLGLIPQTIVGKKAFLGGAKTGVIQTPNGKPEDNQIVSEVEIDFTPDGTLKAVSKNLYQGRSEIVFRPLFSNSFLQKNSEMFVSAMLGYYGITGTGKILKIGNPFKVGEPFTIDMQVNVEDYTTFTPRGMLRMPLAVNLMDMLALQQYTLAEKRKTNILLGSTRLSEKYIIKLPADVVVGTLPANINFSNELGSFKNEFKMEENAVIVIRELTLKKDVIEAGEYEQIRDLIGKVASAFNTEIPYQANPNLVRLESRQLRGKKPVKTKTLEEIVSANLGYVDEEPLTIRQTAQFEAKLTKNAADLETRRRLLRHYVAYDTKQTAATATARLKHRIWLIQNHPEHDDNEFYEQFDKNESELTEEYKAVKTEWLKQIQTKPDSEQIRINAVNFFKEVEADIAEKILLEGRKLDAENYRFAILLTNIYDSQAKEKEKQTPENLSKILESGEISLSLLKKERSDERDTERSKILPITANAALKLGKLKRAKSLATELILDFGADADNSHFDDIAHVGNILLGRIALRENNLPKAKEYLLIAIRAPLRKKENWLTTIDTQLAKELYEKGEKTAVSEYLKLCESLWHITNYTDLYEDEGKALKLWQEQIKLGKTPSFDFEKP